MEKYLQFFSVCFKVSFRLLEKERRKWKVQESISVERKEEFANIPNYRVQDSYSSGD